MHTDVVPAPAASDAEDRAWLQALRATGSERELAAGRLHALLLRAARFELGRRRHLLDARGERIDDLAVQSADNALAAILTKLDSFRFESRFTTWAYKFAILEASVAARRRAWQERELPVDPHAWSRLSTRAVDPAEDLATRERLRQATAAIRTELSPHQREVLTALVFAEVPIDVLAERLNTTRGALYKTLHDARRRLRAVLDAEEG
ncbi:MAG: RNA polymerase sigma factor [Solirubrobacteraceae bacterium]